jgi:hypothetical protein
MRWLMSVALINCMRVVVLGGVQPAALNLYLVSQRR